MNSYQSQICYFTTRNIHIYDKNFNDESETIIKNCFYDENFSFVIDCRDEPQTPLIYDKIGHRHKKTSQNNITFHYRSLARLFLLVCDDLIQNYDE